MPAWAPAISPSGGSGVKLRMGPGPACINQRLQGIDCERGEQAVGMRERRAADDGGSRSALRELMRETLDDGSAHSGLLLDRFRGVVRQARGPAGDERTGARSGRLAAPAFRSG